MAEDDAALILTAQEMTTAAMVGVRRWITVLAKDWRSRHSPKNLGEGFQGYIISAMAEFVVARDFNMFWPDGVGKREGEDVGGIIQVRCRPIPGVGVDMGFKETDVEKNRPFVLVHAYLEEFRFHMVGWMYAKDGWAIGKDNGKGVRFVPPKFPPLREMDELRSIIKEMRHE